MFRASQISDSLFGGPMPGVCHVESIRGTPTVGTSRMGVTIAILFWLLFYSEPLALSTTIATIVGLLRNSHFYI